MYPHLPYWAPAVSLWGDGYFDHREDRVLDEIISLKLPEREALTQTHLVQVQDCPLAGAAHLQPVLTQRIPDTQLNSRVWNSVRTGEGRLFSPGTGRSNCLGVRP